MARFLGDASGRTSSPYTNTQVNTACSNLCTYVNTNKLSCTGSGSGVTGIVTSITAGSGVSVNQSTGTVTISASGGTAPTVLYNCACYCANYGICIPSGSRGVFQRYEIMGSFCSWNYYCSQFTASFAGACGGSCSCNSSSTYCCSMCSSGNLTQAKCWTGSYTYGCDGAIAWPFGCSTSCLTACSSSPFQYHVALQPIFPCCGGYRCFSYCFRTTGNGSNSSNYCYGITNTGKALPCCGAHPACLQCICFTTPSATGNANGSVIVVGYGKLSV